MLKDDLILSIKSGIICRRLRKLISRGGILSCSLRDQHFAFCKILDLTKRIINVSIDHIVMNMHDGCHRFWQEKLDNWSLLLGSYSLQNNHNFTEKKNKRSEEQTFHKSGINAWSNEYELREETARSFSNSGIWKYHSVQKVIYNIERKSLKSCSE